MTIFNEVKNLRQLLRRREEIIIYSEGRNYFPNFEGIIKELDSLCYVTSDSSDSILSRYNTYYLNKLFPFYMAFANCKILLMTMTDFNLFHIRRSINPVHYVYIFHSLFSTHMVYRYGAFDHYDSILCVGPHQVKEIRKHERLYGLKPKNLIETGYYGLERLHKAYKNYKKEGNGITVLIAPTWGLSSLMEICGKELIDRLLKEKYKVILRLHPETVKRHQFREYDGVILETSVVNIDSLVESDILITDWSAISLEYAFGTERPVILIDTPPKVRNPRFRELDIEPIECSLRNEIGEAVFPNELSRIPQIINDFISSRESYKETLSAMRDKYVFNFGHSSKVGADYIKGLQRKK